MAWNRKGVTYVVTDAPCYEVADGETLVDRYVGAEPMAGAVSMKSGTPAARNTGKSIFAPNTLTGLSSSLQPHSYMKWLTSTI